MRDESGRKKDESTLVLPKVSVMMHCRMWKIASTKTNIWSWWSPYLDIKATVPSFCKTPKQNQTFCWKFTISSPSFSCSQSQFITIKVKKKKKIREGVYIYVCVCVYCAYFFCAFLNISFCTFTHITGITRIPSGCNTFWDADRNNSIFKHH